MGCCVIKDQGADGLCTPRLSPQVSYPDGATYMGDIRQPDGMRHGEGLCLWPDGAHYEGQWASGKAHGFGHFEYADGAAYDGQWRHGKAHGRGIFIRADGSRFESEWRDNAPVLATPLPHGRGHIRWSDSRGHQAEYVLFDEAGGEGPSGLFPQARTVCAATVSAIPSACSGSRGPWRGELSPDSSVVAPPAWKVGEWVPFRFSIGSPPPTPGRIYASSNSKSCPASMSSRATLPQCPHGTGHAVIVPKVPEQTSKVLFASEGCATDSDEKSDDVSEEHWEGDQASDASDMVEHLKSMPRRRASSLDAERFGRGAFIPLDSSPTRSKKSLLRRWTLPVEGSTMAGFFYSP